ncbi:MAG: hypothetical protein Q9182_005351 [Xanthomendoza sp. 2 TL-2023]
MDLRWIPPPSQFIFPDHTAAPASPSSSATSPQRRQTPAPTQKVVDPLLSNLSPSSTLEALNSTSTEPSDALHESIASASLSERAFAVRAAIAGKQLKEWNEEVRQWHWDGLRHPFETPAQTTANASDDGLANMLTYYGSLPAHTVQHYQHRIDMIRQAMAALELDELKMHLRNIHTTSSASYNHLDDFTAIVTTIVLQALPLVYRLEALLGTWDARLAVLQASPAFTDTMHQTQHQMSAAWRALDSCHDAGNNHLSPLPMREFKLGLECQIRNLGQRLDFMLDILEGRQDTVPDLWIDEMEQLESEFGDWVVEAEKSAIDLELRNESVGRSGHVNGDQIVVTTATPSIEEPDSLPMLDGAMDGKNDRFLHLGHRPLPLNLHQHRRNHSNALSDVSYPGSATSDYFSDMSSPEIQDASKTEYFGVGSPVEVITPGLPRRESRVSGETVSRQSSQHTEQGNGLSRSRASTINAEPSTMEHDVTEPAMGGGPLDMDCTVVSGNEVPNATPRAAAKPRHRFEEVTDLSPGSTPMKIFRRTTASGVPSTPNRMVTASPTKSTGDQLEARITSILTDIPANIRLAPSSETSAAAMAAPTGDMDVKTARRSPTPRLVRAQTVGPSPHNTESDIRLYHLHQAGKDPPIRLLVRLVGGGERVMVRIGGGWADLAEYLKEYATHHGGRTVSGTQFDFRGLPPSQTNSPGSFNQPTPERSEPAAMIKSRRGSTASTRGVDGAYADGFRPTSRGSNGSRGSWVGEESPSLGLAGPKSRKSVVSPNKQAWVDTMMKKARNVHGEKKAATRDSFGELGIIGGTKRLFMRKAH